MVKIFTETAPRLFGLPSGSDIARRLVAGLYARLDGQPPEAMARITLILNTNRLRKRLREAFLERGATLMPRMKLVAEIGADPLLAPEGDPVSRLGRRLELAVLVDRLLQAQPDLAPRSALYDLADSLANLMDEMRAENVPPGKLASLDMGGHAGHWTRTAAFVSLVEGFFGPDAKPDSEGRQRAAVLAQIARWQDQPPQDPVIVAGSTGSRGTTALLMEAVARLPQGALLLPGFDWDLPTPVWRGMGGEKTKGALQGQEDHPQYRYHRLMTALGLDPQEIRPWDDLASPDPARNALISLALRPAPVTDQWISHGPKLGDLTPLARTMTLIEAPNLRLEAQAIALCLRHAVEEGRKVTLITPDRDLTRRVSAALDRWNLRPDDSAGEPLQHSAPGRLLRLTARAMGQKLAVDELLALLKHPLTFSGGDRGPHLLFTRELELKLRKNGPAFPDAAVLADWAKARKEELAPIWAERLGAVLTGLSETETAPLPALIAQHRRLTEALAMGTGEETGRLWSDEAGQEALVAMEEMALEAPEGFTLSLGDYINLLDGVLSGKQVRKALTPDSRIEILGPQEARIVGADMVILAGLNEGVWPGTASPDPWLNRQMRLEAGLLLPERRIGLSAHDFQMAIGAREVVLTRAARDAEAETVPSRWLNRLTNLLGGLGPTGGVAALKEMRAKGQQWIAEAEAVETPAPIAAEPRPSPRPPLTARPDRLSLTEIEKLVRDPYAIYASHILRLRPLPPLRPLADARLRGEVLHQVPERFLKKGLPEVDAEAFLLQITDEVLAENVPWPAMRAIWRARMAEIAEPFIEGLRKAGGTPVAIEKKREIEVPGLKFRLVGKPDRLDLLEDGRLRVVDYKTGTPPSLEQQKIFAKQLHLAAVMAYLGAFPEAGLPQEAELSYIALRKDLKEVASTLNEAEIETVLDEFRKLILSWQDRTRGYTARRAMVETKDKSDYDDLARYGEWDLTDEPQPKDVG